MRVLPVCICIIGLPRMELQKIVRHLMGARNQTWVLCKSNKS